MALRTPRLPTLERLGKHGNVLWRGSDELTKRATDRAEDPLGASSAAALCTGHAMAYEATWVGEVEKSQEQNRLRLSIVVAIDVNHCG
jgi:hypothetical protein